MSTVRWKVSTFLALGAAAYFALHPLHGAAGAADGPAKAAHKKQNGFLGSLFGAPEDDGQPTRHVGQKLAALYAATTAEGACEALSTLGPDAAGDAEATDALGERTTAKYPFQVRGCAISSLGQVRTGASRVWLVDALGDPDRQVREQVIDALAQDADGEARRALFGVARSPDAHDRVAALVALGEQHVPEAGPLLAAEIERTTDFEVQGRLAQALGQSGAPEAAQALLKLATSGSSAVRAEALRALGRVGGDGAVAALEGALKDGGAREIDAVTDALAQRGDARAKQALIAAAADPRRVVASAALRALARLDGDDVRDVMSRALDSGDRDAVSAAIQYVTSKRDDSAVAKLADLAQNGSSQVRGQAVSALRGLGSEAAKTALFDLASKDGAMQGEALGQLAALPGGEEKARAVAVGLLRDAGGRNADYAINVLAADGSAEARAALADAARGGSAHAGAAMQALAQHPDDAALRVLGDLAQHGKNVETRSEALSALGASADPKAAPVLLAAARDSDARVQRQALSALQRVGGADAERALLDATRSADVGLRTYAVSSLGRLGTRSAEAQLERLAGDKDPDIARVALGSLVQHSPARAAAFVDRALQSPDARSRAQAVSMSSNLDAAASRRIALAAARDPDDVVVSTAISQLEELGGADAQGALVDLLTGSRTSEQVKRGAADALDRMGGEAARRFAREIERHKSSDGDEGHPDVLDGPEDE